MSNDRFVRSKIVCTIGPASCKAETVQAMIHGGMDVARVNLSHGDIGSHREAMDTIRAMGDVSILVDFSGPRIRVGEVEGSVFLKPGDEVHFTTHPILGGQHELPVTYERLPQEVNVEDSIFLNDGVIEVKILSLDEDLRGFNTVVVSGGEVTSHKGVNAPGARLSMRPPTERDVRDIEFAVGMRGDWFAMSFIRDRRDVENTRKAVERAGGDQPIVSKIEHRDAVTNIDEIIESSDGIMVARGDLGIEIPPWEVPMYQKQIIAKCNEVGKPVIVATQMLESMVTNARPTRAEASDVANAILDGADAIMLSEETAVGAHPVEAVKVMNRIIEAVERQAPSRKSDWLRKEAPIADVIGNIASRASETLLPAAIIVVTRSGFSVRMVSKHRPATPILAVTRSAEVSRRLRLLWGVEPLDIAWTDDRDRLLLRAVDRCLQKDILGRDDVVMFVSGSTLEAPGRTSTLEILSVKDILYNTSRQESLS